MPWLYRAKGREIDGGERARKSKSLRKDLLDARPAQRFRHRKICEGPAADIDDLAPIAHEKGVA
jgi:hypothetical protein